MNTCPVCGRPQDCCAEVDRLREVLKALASPNWTKRPTPGDAVTMAYFAADALQASVSRETVEP